MKTIIVEIESVMGKVIATLTEEEFTAWLEYDRKRPDLVERLGYEATLRMFLTNYRLREKQGAL